MTSPSADAPHSTLQCKTISRYCATEPASDRIDRVALLCLHSSPLDALGGADAGGMNLYVRKLAEGLSAAGIAADIYTRRSNVASPAVVNIGQRARVIHVPVGPPRPVPKSVLTLHEAAML